MRLVAAALIAALAAPAAAAPRIVVWAWERPEDLRFLPPGVEVAVQTGFIELSGEKVLTRGRRFPLRMNGQPTTAVVHIQIDSRRGAAWTPDQRRAAVSAALGFGLQPWAKTLQIDFEVRQSERRMLLDLLADVRAKLPPDTRLSMTAIASWCETEDWIGQAPVDEVAPMLFRMGRDGQGLKAKLAEGGDFARPECRKALGVALDAPLRRAPAHRTLYLFSPRSWRAADFERVRGEIETWAASGH